MENLHTKNCIRTVSGIYVNIVDPKPEMFTIEDIAHGLSNTFRFSGQLRHPYSVLSHSIDVYNSVLCYTDDKRLLLAALLHDAAEAYLTDLPSPIKALIPGYKEIEDRMLSVIAEKFGFDFPLPKIVKDADKRQLGWEWAYLMLAEMDAELLSGCYFGREHFINIFESLV